MLVFVQKQFWLGSSAEKAIYDLHENNAQDLGYRKFLSRLSIPLLNKLSLNQKGLDFGCGPGPALSFMLEEEGQNVDNYDPIYFNNQTLLDNQYDFICATEVVEHLKYPSFEFDRLFSMLKPGGWLGIMTKLVISKEAFSHWHYIQDMTHISFFSQDTFKYLATRFNAGISFIGKDVVLLQKSQEE